MTGPYFVDTNILVYARGSGTSEKELKCRNLLSKLWELKAGRLSFQVLSEFYSVMTRKLKAPHEMVVKDVRALFAWNPYPLDQDVFERAWHIGQHFSISWWDSLIVGCAICAKTPIIISEDLQDGAKFENLVSIVNPFLSPEKLGELS